MLLIDNQKNYGMYQMYLQFLNKKSLAKRLKQKTFADYVFFQNSGAEKPLKQQLNLQEDIFFKRSKAKK